MQVPSNRKARIAAVRDPKTSPRMLEAILDSDYNVDLIRSFVQREDCPDAVLRKIARWCLQTSHSKYGPTYEGTDERPLFGKDDPDQEYKEYQSRYSILLSMLHRKKLPTDVVEDLANDKRVDGGPANLAANGHLSDEYILRCLSERPETRRYFYVFPKELSQIIQDELFEIIIEESNREWLDMYLRRYPITEVQKSRLRKVFGAPESKPPSEEEAEAALDKRISEVLEFYDKRLEKFYMGGVVEFISGQEFAERICPWTFESIDIFNKPVKEMMENFHEGIRADFYAYAENLSVELQREIAEEDYYYPCFYLASRKDLDHGVAERFLNDEFPILRFAVAMNSALPSELVASALEDPDPTVRIGYAQRSLLTASEVLKILNDTVPAVSQILFNENGLHYRGTNFKFSSGSSQEFNLLASESSVHIVEQLARLLTAYAKPEVVPALISLAFSKSGNRRVALLRPGTWNDFVAKALDDGMIIKLAGDKLSQVRKYVVNHVVGRDVRQLDYFRLIDEPNLNSLQKAVLAAGLTDRAEFQKVLRIKDDLIQLGCYLNWKSSEQEVSMVRFLNDDWYVPAENLRKNRDSNEDFVTPKPYQVEVGPVDARDPSFYEIPAPIPWIRERTREEQDEFWGGKFPRSFEEMESQL